MRNALRRFIGFCLFPFGLLAWLTCFGLACLPLSPTRVGLRNLRARLGARPVEARRILAGVYFQYACYFVEIVILWPLGLLEATNLNEFSAFLARLKRERELGDTHGVMCLGAHYGNIEALGLAMKDAFREAGLKPFYVLAKPARFRVLEALLRAIRQGRGFLMLNTRGARFKEEFGEVAASGHGLAMLVDQKPRKGGLFVPFFGEPAAFPDAGVAIGISQGMALIHITHRRISLGKFELVFQEGANPHKTLRRPTSDPRHAEDVRVTFVAYAAWLETVIRAGPSLWSWEYRKWSRVPLEKGAEKRPEPKRA